MTIVAANWVGENTSTLGTGPLALSGAISTFCPFSVLPDGSEVYYTLQEGFNRETGIGVVSNGTLTRKVQATLVAGVYTETDIPISLVGNGQVFAVINADFMTRIYNLSLDVADSVAAAAASAQVSADSVAAAAASAQASADSAALANNYETQSEQNAENASLYSQSASDSKIAADASKTAAANSASAAANSQADALASKNAAASSQADALASKNAAKTSETNSKNSETASAQSATNSANSADTALNSKNDAKTSETNSKTSETNAKNSEINAAASQTDAANSASAANTAKTGAEAAAASVNLGPIGIGLPSMTLINNFDWQNFVFTSGANYLAASTSWINAPAGVGYPAALAISITVDYITVSSNQIGLTLIPNTATSVNFKVYKVLSVGAAGSRVFTVREEWNSANPIPISGGGTGATTTDGAIANLELGEGSLVPIGIPLPYPQATPPYGYLKCNGSSFSTTTYPRLALRYPSGVLPDIRSNVIRAWDDGRGIDPARALLTEQMGSYLIHEWTANNVVGFYSANGVGLEEDPIIGAIPALSAKGTTAAISFAPVKIHLGIARMRNISFNYIVRAL